MPLPGSTRARLALATLALAILASLAYATLPWWLAEWAEHTLEKNGFTRAQVELSYPGLRGIRVHHLELSGTAAGQSYEFGARDLEIGYDPATLLAGRINTLRIAAARLRLAPAVPEPLPPADAAAPFSPGDWVATLPLDQLVIKALRVEHARDGAGKRAITLRGEARRGADRLRSHWTVADHARALLAFDLDLATNGELSAALYPPDAPEHPVLRATQTLARPAAGRIALQGSIEAELARLGALLSPWWDLPKSLAPMGGQVRARWSGEAPSPDAPGANGASLALHLELKALGLGSSVHDGSLRLDIEATQEGNRLHWRIGDRSQLAARLDPSLLALAASSAGDAPAPAPEPLVVRAPRGLSGSIARLPSSGYRLTLAPGAELVLEAVHTPEVRIPSMVVTTPGPAHLEYDAASGGWASQGLAATLRAPLIDPRLAALGRIEDVTLRASLAPGPIGARTPAAIEEAGLRLLGGRVRGRDIHFVPGGASPPFTLHLEEIDLARVVALERQQEIEASGRLDGRLPITLTPRGLRIHDGRLSATDPGGVIRYHAGPGVASMAATNPNLNLVLQALSNYHYDSLSVGVNYAENGDLALTVSMAGRNPDWNAGQAINLNISVDENVPMLLRSLRLAEDVSGVVEKRVQQRRKPKP